MLTIVEGWPLAHRTCCGRLPSVYPPKTKMVRMCQMMQAASDGPWVSSVPNIPRSSIGRVFAPPGSSAGAAPAWSVLALVPHTCDR